jgi:putative Ca2+/H+ antiporter (TMEM165/GDT1 family)
VEPFLTSLAVVALAEIGDRTQLLAVFLAAQFRRPVPILLGILVATLANHALAGVVGAWVGALLTPALLRWGLGASYVAMAVWMLVPDRMTADAVPLARRRGAFVSTVICFFLCEMGDKTQIATAALAARFEGLLIPVVLGTTTGMFLANVPAVLFGHHAAERLEVRWIRYLAAAIFAAEAALTCAGYRLF